MVMREPVRPTPALREGGEGEGDSGEGGVMVGRGVMGGEVSFDGNDIYVAGLLSQALSLCNMWQIITPRTPLYIQPIYALFLFMEKYGFVFVSFSM